MVLDLAAKTIGLIFLLKMVALKCLYWSTVTLMSFL